MNTKQIALTGLILAFSTTFGFLSGLYEIPMSFMIVIFFYPLLNRFLLTFYAFDFCRYIWRAGLYSYNLILNVYGTDMCPEIINKMSQDQVFVFGYWYITVIYLVTGASLVNGLIKVGYYDRVRKTYRSFMV